MDQPSCTGFLSFGLAHFQKCGSRFHWDDPDLDCHSFLLLPGFLHSKVSVQPILTDKNRPDDLNTFSLRTSSILVFEAAVRRLFLCAKEDIFLLIHPVSQKTVIQTPGGIYPLCSGTFLEKSAFETKFRRLFLETYKSNRFLGHAHSKMKCFSIMFRPVSLLDTGLFFRSPLFLPSKDGRSSQISDHIV